MCDSHVLKSSYDPMRFGSAFLSPLDAVNYSEMDSEVFYDIQSDLRAENEEFMEEVELLCSCVESNDLLPRRRQLEEDIQKLQARLQEEMNIRYYFQMAVEQNSFLLEETRSLPAHDQELLFSISSLEIAISDLEKQIVFLNIDVTKERNERIISEYYTKQFIEERTAVSSPHKQDPKKQDVTVMLDRTTNTMNNLEDPKKENVTVMSDRTTNMMNNFLANKLPRMLSKGLLEHPNILSEEMVKCMKEIFVSLADSSFPSKSCPVEGQTSAASPRGHFSIISSWGHNPQIDIKNYADIFAQENEFDPYRVRGKLRWVDIGSYNFATEVSWMSGGKKQLEYASGALRKFRILVELLAKVNPVDLCNNEKLAFWINLYNALMMHAYLAYGIPKSDLKLFSLMQKAAYTVGGHSFSAALIEYVILKMKPPLHRPQIALILALRKLKVSDEQKKFAIDKHEPSVTFALSCGMYSSPAVRVFTAKHIKEELEDAQHDFIRASVGMNNKGKLVIPKMLYCFAKSSVDDSNLVAWISAQLLQCQAAFIEKCTSHKNQTPASSRNCQISPFDSRFRYLFLSNNSSNHLGKHKLECLV